MKAEIKHTDLLGKEINVGSFVAFNWWNGSLTVCVVDKISPKMIKVRPVNRRQGFQKTKNRYPLNVILLNEDDATMYILKNGIK
jgi:hypothetical protein